MTRTTIPSTQVRDDNILIQDLADFAVIKRATGLTIDIQAGRIRNDNTITDKTATTLTVGNNTTTFVEIDTTGTVQSNTSAFTVGRIALATVVSSGGNVTTVNDKRTWVGVQTNITGNASTVTTNANLTGPITSVGNATSVASQTGTGSTFVMSTSPTLVTPLLGTPTSGTLTNCTGLPVSTGISGLGTGIATFLATPSSANLISAITDETGTGALVFATSPTLVTPVLGTPSSGTLTNCTGLPISTGVSGLGTGIATFLATPSSANLISAVTDETGTGSLVFSTSPTLVTPSLGVATATSVNGLTLSSLSVGFSITGGTSPTTLTVDSTVSTSALQPLDATLTALAGLTITANSLIYGTGTDAFAVLAQNTTATRKFLREVSSTAPVWDTLSQSDISGLTTSDSPSFSGLTLTGDLTLSTHNLITDTTTGTKIGTSTTQKLGFFNATPVVQQLATTDLGTVLSNLGLRASGTAYPITTSGAVSFTGGLTISTANLTITDVDIVLSATTGTKIGTATSQKLGFYNSTPIVKPSGNALTALSNLGLITSPTLLSSDVGLGNVTNDAQIKASDFPSTSVDSEIVLFSGTTGKVVKRASASGVALVTSGVLSVVTIPSDATKFLNGSATPAYAQVKDSDLSTSDITTNNVSISKHGFAPKSPNDATQYLDGTGNYSVPTGSGTTLGQILALQLPQQII